MTRADGIRARNRAAMEGEILAVARDHLGKHGAAALSLRAVARDLGRASSPLYRYADNPDDLLTPLSVSPCTALAETVEAGHAAVRPEDLDGRWRARGTALRDWARAHPH